MLTYPEMIVVGLLQGVSELFPVSSLGHSVLIPALIGGQWAKDLDTAAPGSAYLNSLVAMHVATAIGLIVFFARDWARIITGLYTSIRHRRIRTPYERLAWLLVVGTIPVGIAGLALDKVVREYLAQPVPAAIFLALNGLLLLGVERWQRRRPQAAPELPADALTEPLPRPGSNRFANAPTERIPVLGYPDRPGSGDPETDGDERLSRLPWLSAALIGACQIGALLPGISRSGATIAGGLLRGLRHEDAARFAFLLATPVILAAGVLKLPELAAPDLRGSVGPIIAGSVVAGVGAYLSVRFLVRYFQTRTLTPFGIYCLLAGVVCLVFFAAT